MVGFQEYIFSGRIFNELHGFGADAPSADALADMDSWDDHILGVAHFSGEVQVIFLQQVHADVGVSECLLQAMHYFFSDDAHVQ